ncbi:MAG TPA: hypothetical protein PKN49_11170 [Candidatus Aminicenantes bacterium]|nr:hypothetical protein [Candidatus Aminicenantes bacterium]
MKKAALVLLLAGTAVLLYVAARQYAGNRLYGKYERLRGGGTAAIIDDFDRLEAALAGAVRAWKNPDFHRALGRLYLDRALAEDKLGEPARRDEFLDKAAAALVESIRRNPLDSWAYFDLGAVWTLVNAPLFTYADKGRRYMRRALELNPAHEALNLRALSLFLGQWNMLDAAEKAFVKARLERKWREKPAFIGLLRRQWIQEAKTDAGLRAVLMSDKDLWNRIGGNFR